MNDRELLEMAAKAAGIKGDWNLWRDQGGAEGCGIGHGFNLWNPLTDDGDALRLAVELGFHIYQPIDIDVVTVSRNDKNLAWSQSVEGDVLKATRYAIVKLAAQIQKEKEE